MNQVLMRSLNTSLAAVLPVLSLLVLGSGVFGAIALREFAIALLVGLLTGSYSSIYIATPLLAIFKQRETRYKNLIGDHATGAELAAWQAMCESDRAPLRTFHARAMASVAMGDDEPARCGPTLASDARIRVTCDLVGRVVATCCREGDLAIPIAIYAKAARAIWSWIQKRRRRWHGVCQFSWIERTRKSPVTFSRIGERVAYRARRLCFSSKPTLLDRHASPIHPASLLAFLSPSVPHPHIDWLLRCHTERSPSWLNPRSRSVKAVRSRAKRMTCRMRCVRIASAGKLPNGPLKA
jgi:hypothetical protein